MTYCMCYRVIAGNHDLTLDDANSEQLYSKFGIEDILSESVCVITFAVSFISNDDVQARREIKDLLIGPRAKAAGVVYLENEEHSFQIKEGRKTWSVYGSPVGTYSIEIVLNSTGVI